MKTVRTRKERLRDHRQIRTGAAVKLLLPDDDMKAHVSVKDK